MRQASIVGVALALTLLVGPLAHAEPVDEGDSAATTTANSVLAKANGQRHTSGSPGRKDSAVGAHATTQPAKSPYQLKVEAWERQMRAAAAYNAGLANSWDACVTGTATANCGQYLGRNRALPTRPDAPEGADGDATPAAPPIPPEVIAYQAVAELRLTAPKPVIGPPPEINRWKTAVVGYPLWLAVDGDTTPPAVSDSVYDVSVSLQARLTKVVFDMGDGSKVTCTEPGHAWNQSVAVRAESPWCGYTYTAVPKASKTYAVTADAFWAVDWTINGTSGTLPFYQASTVQLPVSELQVLVR